ncbi:hypothetical protein HYS01_02785 [Candidatus Saccharibacteria bacterium]|nr:hypothetical protein [Candidatus Saccharibacteria bacterium]
MNTSVISIKTDPKTKKELQGFAESLGMTVSGLINAQVRQMLRDRKVVLTDTLEPTPYLENIMRQTEKDLKTGKNISKPMTPDELFDHLASL